MVNSATYVVSVDSVCAVLARGARKISHHKMGGGERVMCIQTPYPLVADRPGGSNHLKQSLAERFISVMRKVASIEQKIVFFCWDIKTWIQTG